MSKIERNNIDASNLLDHIEGIFCRRGAESYLGEQVSMAQHMLQAAQCAEQAGAKNTMIAAALLHDIGHYANEIPETALAEGQDNYHEQAGASFLEPYFDAAVIEPIRQHVATKRYLCAVQPSYLVRLSDASAYTLKLQGGPMSAEEVQSFETNPHLQACIDVRVWDEEAKDPTKEHPEFSYYRPLLEQLMSQHLAH
ncbi:MAG: HD domain-containing protein [Gammaproteobacteria bacterium]|nr:HD domain-containing protein [Gammaproteobacteria bacterium]